MKWPRNKNMERNLRENDRKPASSLTDIMIRLCQYNKLFTKTSRIFSLMNSLRWIWMFLYLLFARCTRFLFVSIPNWIFFFKTDFFFKIHEFSMKIQKSEKIVFFFSSQTHKNSPRIKILFSFEKKISLSRIAASFRKITWKISKTHVFVALHSIKSSILTKIKMKQNSVLLVFHCCVSAHWPYASKHRNCTEPKRIWKTLDYPRNGHGGRAVATHAHTRTLTMRVTKNQRTTHTKTQHRHTQTHAYTWAHAVRRRLRALCVCRAAATGQAADTRIS